MAVGLQARSTPTIRYLHDLIAAGEIGEVLSSTLVGSGGNWGGEVAPRNDYILDAANGATMTAIPFGHTLDAVVHVLGGLRDVAATTAIVRPQAVDSASGARLPKTAADQLALSATLRSGAVLLRPLPRRPLARHELPLGDQRQRRRRRPARGRPATCSSAAPSCCWRRAAAASWRRSRSPPTTAWCRRS